MAFRIFSPFLFLLLLTSCASGNSTFPVKEESHGYISRVRFERIRTEKIVYALDDGTPAAAASAKILTEIFGKQGIQLSLRTVPKERFPSALRAGRADLAIGTFQDKEAESYYLRTLDLPGCRVWIRDDDPDFGEFLLGEPREKQP